ncbi:MAG: hypothetical protein HY819_11600 [Acidobacteria bacterium]|nr:hypothetical protein [Acidobacteriota bacterium]
MKRVIFTILILTTIALFQTSNHSSALVTATLWHYEVTATEGGKELFVEVTLPPKIHPELSVYSSAEPYLKGAEILSEKGWQPLRQQGLSWFLPASAKIRGCRIRYHYQLAQAAQAISNIEIARQAGDLIYAPPSTWLLFPIYKGTPQKVTFHVKTPPGTTFVSGVFPLSSSQSDTYEINSSSLYELSYSAFGKMRLHTINLQGGKIDLAIAQSNYTISDDQIIKWVTKAGKSIATYYDGFPIHRVLVLVRVTGGRRIGYGSALGNSGAAVSISVGVNARQSDFDDDWVLTHELAHIAFPSVPRGKHAWLEEGMATYIEPISRMRTGELSPEKVWGDMLDQMPQGQPEYGDKGLDYTPSWGRTYWGGALFCLVADVEIRQKTKNRYGLEHAFRGIVAAGGTMNNDWDVIRTLSEGDKTIGVSVLIPLYNKMKATPVEIDLDGLWKRLGVEQRGNRIVFNDNASQAEIRRAITYGDK